MSAKNGKPKRPKGEKPKRPKGVKPKRVRSLYFPVSRHAVGRAVDEGVLMSRTALTMATMNHIIVGALMHTIDYDPVEIAAFVRNELRLLSLEQATMAEHMKRLMLEFPPQFTKSRSVADFQWLTQRRVTYSSLATELARLHDDTEFVAEAVDSSQKWAWSELSRAIEVRLQAVAGVDAAPDYSAERDQRMRALREVDLPALAARQSGTSTPPG
ncbi:MULTISPECIES: hypothetical protein [Subtercola]|uniref:Uncharacterized protein n=1 Tax=Subtercola vilae TaxID=2056433 RepID=A0A4T2CA89_9MICO|nr:MULTISPECIES: hypothetical protein [Subtercola]MEA9983863.1 hypothetical protein [Subtercola sp. RTI3]TIH40602.1 hypothetical protein D4765_01040 [Subtercola vilae]